MYTENLWFRYNNDSDYLIKNLNIEIKNNDKICIIGENGKGKSTLLKLLAGKLKPEKGIIHTYQNLITNFYSDEKYKELNPDNSVVDEIFYSDYECSLQKAYDISGLMMFEGEYALKPIRVLSGGEKNRVVLGKTLVFPSNLIFLDEPTNHLDLESCDALINAVKIFPGSVITVTHNELFLKAVANKLIVFDNDEVFAFNGTYDEFIVERGFSKIVQEKKTDESKLSKKEYRKIKSAQLQEKNRILKPLKNEITDTEKKISDSENEINIINQKLAELALQKFSNEIVELSQKKNILESELVGYYDKLIELTDRYENLVESIDS
jgi:ATP-binding cassette subfamily F protein 3